MPNNKRKAKNTDNKTRDTKNSEVTSDTNNAKQKCSDNTNNVIVYSETSDSNDSASTKNTKKPRIDNVTTTCEPSESKKSAKKKTRANAKDLLIAQEIKQVHKDKTNKVNADSETGKKSATEETCLHIKDTIINKNTPRKCGDKTNNANTVSITSDIAKNSTNETYNRTKTIDSIKTKSDATMATYNVPTKNSFVPLDDEEENQNNSMEEDNTQKETHIKPPPPIIIHGQTNNHGNLTNAIKEIVNCDFHIKYTKDTINVTINNREDRKTFIEHLKSSETEFHTFTDTDDKTHAFVIRGLTNDVEPAEIEEQLINNYGIPVKKCYKMEFKKYPRQNTTQALFLLITTNKITLKGISQKAKYIMHTRIYFERRRNTKRITQCHNCQGWGHATTNCYAATICMFCAKDHKSNTCENKEAEPQCANCTLKHQANDITCPTYIEKINWLDTNAKKNQKARNTNYQHREEDYPTTFKPAPPPQQNAWTQRATQQQLQQQQLQQQQSQQQEQHQGTQQQSSQQGQPRQPPTYTGKPPISYQQPIDTFKELTDQFAIMHSMVNINGILQAVKDLNTQLKTCTTPEQTFHTFTQFTSNLSKYNINN